MIAQRLVASRLLEAQCLLLLFFYRVCSILSIPKVYILIQLYIQGAGDNEDNLTHSNEKYIVINVKGKGCFCGVKYLAHLKEKQQHTNATQHEASSTAKLAAMLFYFLFFPFLGKLQEGCLQCYRVWVVANEIVWPQHLRPLLATMSQTLTSVMEKKNKKKNSVQRQLATLKCKKLGSCRARADLLTVLDC